jgi:16S rRNA (cytosine967-C5)-methyltransferase
LKKTASQKTATARGLALDVLSAARREGRSVEDLLAAALKRHAELPREERAFLLELVQGVKRWELRLDFFLSALASRPLKKLHPLVLIILRLSAYQLLMLERVPARAVLHEAGKLAQARGLPREHAGFINAVLRKLAAGDLPALPAPETDPVTALSLTHSHPAWLVARWLARWGFAATQARLQANNRVPPLTIRINTLKTDAATLKSRLAREGVDAVPCQFSPVGFFIRGFEKSPVTLASYQEGLWLFQDEAAQLTGYLLDAHPGQSWLEIGAGRGGKTTHLGEWLAQEGFIPAVDLNRRRLQELQANLRRWGVAMVCPLLADATEELPFKPDSLDGVLLDAPCSSLGVIRRHPEIKGRVREADLAQFPPRQRAMLERAAPLLRRGGRIIYITCTTEPQENEDLVAAFLQRHADFHLATAPGFLPPPARPLIEPPGWFRSTPEDHNLDAFFAAVLVKR